MSVLPMDWQTLSVAGQLDYVEGGNIRLYCEAAQSEKTHKPVLVRLAHPIFGPAHWSLTQNKQCPVEALEVLSRSFDTAVRRQIASHCSTPSSVLARLSEDDSESVRAGVLCNPNTPSVVAAGLMTDPNLMWELNWRPPLEVVRAAIELVSDQVLAEMLWAAVPERGLLGVVVSEFVRRHPEMQDLPASWIQRVFGVKPEGIIQPRF